MKTIEKQNYTKLLNAYNKKRNSLGITQNLLSHRENLKYLSDTQREMIMPYINNIDFLVDNI